MKTKEQMALHGSHVGVWDWYIKTGVIHYDEMWCEMLGLKTSEVAKDISTWSERVHPDDVEHCHQQIQNTLEGKSDIYRVIHRLRHRDGHWVHIITSGSVVEYNEKNEPLRFVGTHVDITDCELRYQNLKGENELYLKMIQDLPFAVAVLDKDLNYISYSKRWLSDYKLNEEILGRNHYEVFGNIPKEWKQIHQDVLKSGISQRKAHDHFLMNDGSDVFITWEVQALRSRDNEVVGLIFLTEDVTEENILRRNLLDAQRVASIGSWEFSLINESITWSDEMFNIFPDNISEGPPSLEKHKSTIHPDDLSIWEESVEKCINDGKPYEMKFRIFSHDQGIKWLSARGVGRLDEKGNVIGLYGTCQDITKDYLKNREVESLNNELMNFSYRLSHDLKAPILTIEGLADLSLENFNDKEELKENLDDIITSVDQLKETIASSLEVIQATQIDHSIKEVNIQDFLERIISNHQKNIADKNIEIALHKNVSSLKIYDEALNKIVDQLLDNAIKFHHHKRSSKVKISFEVENGFCYLKVKDNGIGIEQKYHVKVFKMFQKFHDNFEGAGLGLYLVKRIVEKLHGEITFTSTNEGTNFYLKWPSLKE